MFVRKPRSLVALVLTLAGLAGCDRPKETACVPEPRPVAPAAVPAPVPPAAAAPAPAGAAAAAPSAIPAAAPAAGRPKEALASNLKIKRLVLSEGVAAREPIGPRRVFRDGENDKVFAFVEVENPSLLPGEIVVSFEPPDGPEIGNVRLSVGATPRWRTWAFSRSVKELGEWTAVVRDGEGRVLAREPFSVAL